jgi:drug/metabolite transporter (DMT)-like permease
MEPGGRELASTTAGTEEGSIHAANRVGASTLISLVTTLVLWGSAFALIRVAVREYSPGQVALLRFLAASAAFIPYALIARVRPPAMRDLWHVALVGFTSVVGYHVLLNYSLVHVPAGPTSMLVNTAPVWTALIAVVFLGERMAPRQWAGVLVSLVGVVMIGAGRWHGVSLDPALLLPLAAALFWSANMGLQKPVLARYGVGTVTVYSVWIGTLGLLPFARGLPSAIAHASVATTLSMLYLGVFPIALAYLTWAHVLATMKASVAAGTLYLIPVIVTIIAWVWLHETLTPLAIAGGGIVISGVALVRANGR